MGTTPAAGNSTIYTRAIWVVDRARGGGGGGGGAGGATITRKPSEFVPAVFKMFGEILENAIDNRQRDALGTTRVEVSRSGSSLV